MPPSLISQKTLDKTSEKHSENLFLKIFQKQFTKHFIINNISEKKYNSGDIKKKRHFTKIFWKTKRFEEHSSKNFTKHLSQNISEYSITFLTTLQRSQ